MRRYIFDWWRKRAQKQLIDQERPITEHLDELRTRLFYSVLGIVLCAILGFVYAREIIGFLMGPLKQAIVGLDIPPQLHFTSITEPLFQSFRIALFAGIFLAFPFWVYQLWQFVAPGLYPEEKKMVGPFITSATFLFLLGATFAYTIAVPLAYRFLLIYANPHQETSAKASTPKKGPMFALREVRPGQRTNTPRAPQSRVLPRENPPTHRSIPTKQQTPIKPPVPVKQQAPTSRPSGALITIQEPGPNSRKGFELKLNLRAPTEPIQEPLHSPEQWLALLLKQKNLDVIWRKGNKQRKFQLQLNWPERPKSTSTMGELKPLLTLQSYLSLSSWFLLGFGLVFQTPLLIFLVILSGLISAEELGQYRRHAFVAILAISAILTPTGDPLNLMIMAVPMYILFEIGLLVSRIYIKPPSLSSDDEE